MKLKTLPLLLTLSACGEDPELWLQDTRETKALFERERAYFERTTGHDTGRISINYGDTDELAACVFWKASGKWHNKHIVVNKTQFAQLSTTWRRAVIAHELIHCHLEQGHEAETSFVRPLTLMAAKLPVGAVLYPEELEKALQKWHVDY